MMGSAGPRKGAARGQDEKASTVIVLHRTAPQQHVIEHVSPALARVARLTRSPTDRLRVGMHRLRVRAFLARRAA